MNFRELQQEIADGRIRHCYLFHGEEKYRMEKTVSYLTEKILGADKNNFNYQIIYGKETNGTAIAQAALTFPFLAKKKLLLIKGAENITNPVKLVKLLAKPPEHCYLIFLADKADFRQKFFSAFRKTGVEVKFWPPFESELPGWIHRQVREEGFRISPQAVEALIALCGNNLMMLDNELGKIFLYKEKKGIISVGEVIKIGGGGPIHTVFQLTDSIGSGNVAQAIGIVEQLFLAGEHPLMVMAMITRQFRNIWQGRQMLTQGNSPERIGLKLRVGKPYIKNFLAQTRRFNDLLLTRIFKILLDYDLRFKSSRVPPRLLMEFLILDLKQVSVTGNIQGRKKRT